MHFDRLNLQNTPEQIELVPVGEVERAVLDRLMGELPERFGPRVRVGESVPLRSAWYDEARGQVQADAILDALVSRRRDDLWLLGIVDADIFVPGLSFIFGQATVGGCCALISLARLRGAFHGEEEDPERFHRRVLIEAVHELGHVAGLAHCPDAECVMHFSETIEDTDRKGPDFCARCTARPAGSHVGGGSP